jgi:hypothetical protein
MSLARKPTGRSTQRSTCARIGAAFLASALALGCSAADTRTGAGRGGSAGTSGGAGASSGQGGSATTGGSSGQGGGTTTGGSGGGGSGGSSGTGSGGSSGTGSGGSSGTGTGGSSGTGSGGSSGTGGGGGTSGGATDAAARDVAISDGGSNDVTADANRVDARPDVRRDADMVDRGPNPTGILVRVRNGCPFDIWIHGAGSGAVLQPDNVRLATGATQDYVAPDSWPAARVTAFGAAPNSQGQPQQELDKVEMTLGNKVINYNVTYVDWLALPVEMISYGTGNDCKLVGCYVPVGDVLQGCPTGITGGRKCMSAGAHCSQSANQSSAYCHALDAKITECAGDAQKYPGCAGAAGATTPQVYGCSGFFGGTPKWCAALNRGMLHDPENGTISLYYKTPPFNTYSQWVHTVCPGIYAFPYDDYGKTNESGFHACSGGTQLDITFCPSG